MAQLTIYRSQKRIGCCGTRLMGCHRNLVGWFLLHLGAVHAFLLHSLVACLPEIPQRFSSSSLPPEFAAGRCAATFIPALAVA